MEKCLFVSRLIGYCILWPLSWFVFVPLSVVMAQYEGYCLLYADRAEFGPVAVCGYLVIIPIIISLMYAGYMAVAYFYKIAMFNKMGYITGTVMEFMVTIIFDGLSWLFMFVEAGLISAGFNTMCWNIFVTIQKCSEGTLKHEVFETDHSFYFRLKMAEVAAWLSWLVWLFVFAMGLLAVWRAGVIPEGDNNDFCCGVLPCKPQCQCACKLHFLRPGQMGGATGAVKA